MRTRFSSQRLCFSSKRGTVSSSASLSRVVHGENATARDENLRPAQRPPRSGPVVPTGGGGIIFRAEEFLSSGSAAPQRFCLSFKKRAGAKADAKGVPE